MGTVPALAGARHLDTNVLVSSDLRRDGSPGRIRRAWQDGAIQVVVTDAILGEYRRALNYPRVARLHGLSVEQVHNELDRLRHVSILVQAHTSVSVVPEDPDDDKFFACAVAGEAEFLISRNAAVLRVGSYQGVQTISPDAFLSHLEQHQPEG